MVSTVWGGGLLSEHLEDATARRVSIVPFGDDRRIAGHPPFRLLRLVVVLIEVRHFQPDHPKHVRSVAAGAAFDTHRAVVEQTDGKRAAPALLTVGVRRAERHVLVWVAAFGLGGAEAG